MIDFLMLMACVLTRLFRSRARLEAEILVLRQLFQPFGRSGEGVEAGGAARALEPVGDARDLGQLALLPGPLHFVQTVAQAIDELQHDFLEVRVVHRKGGL